MTTLGVRNANPMNVRATHDKWVGQIGENKGFVVFKSPEYGIRAGAKTLLNYEIRHGLNTLRGIIARWAPPTENDTAKYIAHVAKLMAIGPDDTISMHRQLTLYAIVISIIQHENGVQPYPSDILLAGVNLALGIN